MTQVSWILPAINATYTYKPTRKRQRVRGPLAGRRNAPRKYDHDAMLRDKIAGMTWTEIAKKYGVPESKEPPGKRAAAVCLRSNAAKRLTPEQMAKIGTATI